MSTLDLGSQSFNIVPDVLGDPVTVSVASAIPALTGGSGAPSATPTYGAGTLYIDTTNFVPYVYASAAWHQLSGLSVTSITGTVNQISVSAATGNSTISISSNPIIPGNASETIPNGTTAQRPATPTVAMLRYNTTEDIIEGYTNVGGPSTTLVDATVFQRTEVYRKRITWEDEFTNGLTSSVNGTTTGYGSLNWTISTNATPTNSAITGIVDHPGILQVGTGANTSNNVRLHLSGAANTDVILANQIEYFAFLVKIPIITNMQLLIGIGQDISSGNVANGPVTTPMGTDGVYFSFIPASSALWNFYTRAGSTTASQGGSGQPTVGANIWYLLEAWYNQPTATWYGAVNGTVMSVQSSAIGAPQPSAAVNVGMILQNTSAASRSVQVDFFAMYTRELGARYP